MSALAIRQPGPMVEEFIGHFRVHLLDMRVYTIQFREAEIVDYLYSPGVFLGTTPRGDRITSAGVSTSKGPATLPMPISRLTFVVTKLEC